MTLYKIAPEKKIYA